MNNIELRGIIKNIQPSHTLGDIEYYKANLLVSRNNKEDLINLKFKKHSCTFKEDDQISITGNVRTFGCKQPDGKNKVEVYVFTYFDSYEDEHTNKAILSGKIHKTNGLRKTRNGKDVIDFILLNEISSDSTYNVNAYIPCAAWGKDAKKIANMNIGDSLSIEGNLVSREYLKKYDDGNSELRVAYEINITNIIED